MPPAAFHSRRVAASLTTAQPDGIPSPGAATQWTQAVVNSTSNPGRRSTVAKVSATPAQATPETASSTCGKRTHGSVTQWLHDSRGGCPTLRHRPSTSTEPTP